MVPQRWETLGKHISVGSLLSLAAFAWIPLWRVERPTGSMAEMSFGTFWEFAVNLPGAVANLPVPQKLETILTILPTVYLWGNLLITFLVMMPGMALGTARWLGRTFNFDAEQVA